MATKLQDGTLARRNLMPNPGVMLLLDQALASENLRKPVLVPEKTPEN